MSFTEKNMFLSGKNVLLGISGGIAAYKACDLCSRLKKNGATVHVIMTKNATELVQPLTLETLSQNPVVTDTFDRSAPWEVEHIALAQAADFAVIAPATANVLAKLAHGIADDMLSTTLLAVRSPVFLAPAMNTAMWTNPATQQNIKALENRGFHIIGPEEGKLACGDTGTGRMSEPADIMEALASFIMSECDMVGLKVVVTAGPTREKLDPVRFLSNRSTGKMGYAIAQAASVRGADVTLISGPVAISAPPACKKVDILTAEELKVQVLDGITDADLLIQAAAPADYRPMTVSDQKIKKSGEQLSIQLERTPDIAYEAGKRKKDNQVFIGFAAETENLLENAKEKLLKKNLDMICANDVSRTDAGFESDTNQLIFLTHNGASTTPLASKLECANLLLNEAMRIYRAKSGEYRE